MKTLKETMQPHGGLAALKLMFKMEGVDLSAPNFQVFNSQAIPLKYAFTIEAIKEKRGIDLYPYLRQDKRVNNGLGKMKDCIYPSLLKKLEKYGIGLIASEINREHNKNVFFPINPPKRFNHYSLQKLLTAKLKPEFREHFIFRCEAEKEILQDEAMQESGLLG